MWANATPILAKLPRLPLNGAHVGDWSACLADLERYRAYSDDWNGQGAKGISGELIDSATELVGLLRSHSVRPPAWVLPWFDGTVIFEWDLTDGGSTSLEILGSETAEFEHYIPNGPYELLKISEPVAA